MTTRPINRCQVCNAVITDDDDEDFQEGKDRPELCGLCNELHWSTP